MATHGSLTELLIQLKAGSGDEAVNQLWQRCFARLVNRASSLLRERPRPAKNEEDVALEAFHSFIKGVNAGRFRRLDNRDDLWQVLLMLTRRKVADLIDWEKVRSPKNGQVRQFPMQVDANSGSSAHGFDPVCPDPDPAEVQAMADSFRKMLQILNDQTLENVAMLKMERYTNKEIADKINRSVAAVERKLRTIRKIYVDAKIWHS